jgi:hypothetical protein
VRRRAGELAMMTPGDSSMVTLAEVRRLASAGIPARSAMVAGQAQVIVGGGGAQRGRAASRLLAKDTVELGVAAEPGFEGCGQGRGAPPSVVETQPGVSA